MSAYKWRSQGRAPARRVRVANAFRQFILDTFEWHSRSRSPGDCRSAGLPLGSLEGVLRADALRRRGNVAQSSALRSDSLLVRYTVGTNVPLVRDWRIKVSAEVYDFSDFDDEVGLHLGVVGAFRRGLTGWARVRGSGHRGAR